MATTVKIISIALTKEDVRILEELTKLFGETPSGVLKRALILLYSNKK